MQEPDPCPLVGIVLGSDSDLPIMEGAGEVLRQFGVRYEMRILSAHRSPEQTAEYARSAADRGLQVLIAGAGWAAHLAGALAAQSILPVIGVPIDSSPLNGIDALLATVQMPSGIPVACMALGKGGAKNAAFFAVAILALESPQLAHQLLQYRQDLARQVLEKDARLEQL